METESNQLISKEEFIKILNETEDQEECISKIFDAGLNICDSTIVDYGCTMFIRVLKAYFTKDGVDWVLWWLYDKNGDPEIKAWDENHKEIKTKDDLWDLIKQYRK